MRSQEISDFLNSRIAAGDFPSAVYLVAEKGEIVLRDALGMAVVEPEQIDARADTIYDLASLTKVLSTGLMAAILVEAGEIAAGDRVADHLAEFGGEDKREITIRDLLSHRSLLPAWLPLYLCVSDPALVTPEIGRTPLIADAGTVTYSDLNFITLGKIIEKVTGKTLDAALTEMVARPLGLQDTSFGPDPSARSRVAASEKGNIYEMRMCIELGYLDATAEAAPPSAFRTETIWGEVHDGNAWFMGGVAGHAGLFSTADEVCTIAHQFLPRYSRLLKPKTCGLFRENFTPGMNEHRSFAFQLASTPECTAGALMSPESFGHLGFTGTSVWIDPVAERVYILLTNRTHHHELPFVLINSVRRKFHEIAGGILDGN